MGAATPACVNALIAIIAIIIAIVITTIVIGSQTRALHRRAAGKRNRRDRTTTLPIYRYDPPIGRQQLRHTTGACAERGGAGGRRRTPPPPACSALQAESTARTFPAGVLSACGCNQRDAVRVGLHGVDVVSFERSAACSRAHNLVGYDSLSR